MSAYTTFYKSPLGFCRLESDGRHLTAVDFVPRAPHTQPGTPLPAKAQAVFAQTCQWLDDYFRGMNPGTASLPLAPHGTPFQQTVWKILTQIPYGATASYGYIAGQVARQLGKKRMSAQAVGQAVGKNPVAIIIPCHRVIGANGQLTGYAAGLAKKRFLLALEKVHEPRSGNFSG